MDGKDYGPMPLGQAKVIVAGRAAALREAAEAAQRRAEREARNRPRAGVPGGERRRQGRPHAAE